MKILLKPMIVLVLLCSGQLSRGQIYVTPSMPTDLDAVTVTFDATQGNGGLAGYSGQVYAHTGVITNLSTGGSDWRYVKADWGVNIPECLMTSLGNDMYQLEIGPDIRDFYQVPAGEQILKLAFVFRSATQVGGAWLEGKTASGGDIFWDVYPSGLSVGITSPAGDLYIAELNSNTTIQVQAFFADSVFLSYDNVLVASAGGNSLSYSLNASAGGAHWLRATASNDTAEVVDSLYFYVRPPVSVEPLPQGTKTGIHYLSDTSVRLALFAPLKEHVFVIGDFNDWLPTDQGYMKQAPDGKTYWTEINGLVPGQEYIFQYLVDGEIRIGDPYAEKVSDPWSDHYITPDTYPGMLTYPSAKTSGMATVLQTGQPVYAWQSGTFTPPPENNLVIYELLIRDFTEAHTFQSVIDTLSYLKNLGINAIELMPPGEFEGNISWGYNPNYYFAVDKYYGKADDLRRLIDTCHQLGIAVFLDVVLNHAFGSSPYVMLYWDKVNNRPAANSPFYNPLPKHDFNVGYDMNHSTPESKTYVSRVLRFWLEAYRVDGFRFDLSKGFTQNNTLGNTGAWGQYDASRIAILTQYFDTIRAVNPQATLILEHFANNDEEIELSNRGMLLWGNVNGSFRYASSGYTSGTNSDFSWGSYKTRGWTHPRLVTYMESHDEERQMVYCLSSGNVTGTYNIRDTLVALDRMKLSGLFLLTIPGPKMIWQFGERGYDYSINWPCMTSNCRLDPKPPRWDYLESYERKNLLFFWSELIRLKREQAVFSSADFETDFAGQLKKLRITDADMSVIVLGNFGVQQGSVIPKFYHTGTWYDYFSGDSLSVTNVNGLIPLKPGEFRIYTSKKLVTPIGAEELEEDTDRSLQAFPNPSSGGFRIRFDIPAGEPYSLEVYDDLGRKISTLRTGITGTENTCFFRPEIRGIYLLRLVTGKKMYAIKLLSL